MTDMKMITRIVAALTVIACLALVRQPAYCLGEEATPQKPPPFSKTDALGLVDESIKTIKKGQEVLRFVSVKLPGLTSDNYNFRRLDKQLEHCRGETYPALDAAERLKTRPQNLRELLRLYLSLRILEERLMLLSDHLLSLGDQSATPLSVQVVDLSNRVGRLSLKVNPYLYRVVDAYQAAAPDLKVDMDLGWAGVEQEIQGPGL
jgi:hypothetical protein